MSDTIKRYGIRRGADDRVEMAENPSGDFVWLHDHLRTQAALDEQIKNLRREYVTMAKMVADHAVEAAKQSRQQAKRIGELQADKADFLRALDAKDERIGKLEAQSRPVTIKPDDDKEQICESCGQIHPGNIDCPPHEVRVTGVACLRMQNNWLKRENLRLRGDVHCAEKVAEVVSNNRNVVETLNDELEQQRKELEAEISVLKMGYKPQPVLTAVGHPQSHAEAVANQGEGKDEDV